MTDQIFIDGALRTLDATTGPELERRLGLAGRFETLLVRKGRARDIAAHLDRLGAGVDLPMSIAELRAAVERVAADWHETGRLRIVLTEPPDAGIAVTVTAYEPLDAAAYQSGVAVHLLSEPVIDSTDVARRQKTLEWRRTALGLADRSVFESLLRNEAGALVEGLRSNVFVLDEEVTTPSLAEGCLPGTVRRRLLEAGLAREARTEARHAPGAEMVLTNSLVGVVPVSMVNDVPCPVGPRAQRLVDFWRRSCDS